MKKNKKNVVTMIFCISALLLAGFLALTLGAVHLRLTTLFCGMTEGHTSAAGLILLHVRLPRLLAAALAGMGLSVAGVLIQTVLTNPLASPSIVGVNAGAGLATAFCMALLPQMVSFLPVVAFMGALATVLLVYGIARRVGASRIAIVLSGVAISSLLTAGINTLIITHPDIMSGLRDFQNGGFSGVSIRTLTPAGIMILVGILVVLMFSTELDVLGLGEHTAQSLGLQVRFFRFLFLTLAAVLSGAVVSFAGLLGFVGLIVPHMARLLLHGGGKRLHLILSALLGATFLILCDTFGRILFAPFELPVGIVVSYLGAPFFLWLFFKERRKHRD